MLWRSVNVFEIVTVSSIADVGLLLSAGTLADWAPGTRLYPLRNARMQTWPQENAWTDAAGTRKVSFLLTDPSDWPSVLPSATYRGMPVLELRSDESTDPTSQFERIQQTVDTTTGPIDVFDYSGTSFPTADALWIASGRAAHSALRSLLYALRGQMQTLWIPSWKADLKIAIDMAVDDTILIVDWCGYTLFGRGQCNRQDIRIELFEGTVLYRRIVAWEETGETEQLALDTAPGIALTVANVRVISFLALSEQASDAVDLHHETDAAGITNVSTSFRAVKHDL
jgi:hypothetical protein